ncbi:1115_t:CDS:2 [Gigaspora rosea]|nr:1115_t:CDS:2 [Gigaspora rosea]
MELDEDDNISQASFSTQSTASTSTSGTSKRLRTNSEKDTKVQSTINQYIGRKLLSNEIDTFFRLLLQLPSRKTLADEILKNSAESIQNIIEVATKEDNYGVSVSLDGWKNIVKQNILGLVITRSDGQVLI